MMRRMTVDACHATLQMEGASIIGLFVTALVAIQAAGAAFRRRDVLKGEYFRYVAAALDVFLAGTVAGFAAVPLRALLRVHFRIDSGDEMGTRRESDVQIFVTCLANLCSDVERRIGRTYIFVRLRRRLGIVFRGLRTKRLGATSHNDAADQQRQ